MMKTTRSVAALHGAGAGLSRPVGFVPTMGALHDGHLELVRVARRRCASVVASVFVNPAQFGPGEDLSTYPRDERRDLELLEREGVAIAFLPPPAEVYPEGFRTSVHVDGPLTALFEGVCRPGHFDGVATVVVKLLNMVAPEALFLGEKDAQQLAVIRWAVRDLDLPVEVVAVPTVREPDGLAMSSRNRRLSADERRAAPRLFAALRAGASVAEGLHRPASADVIVETVHDALVSCPGGVHLPVDYIAVVDPGSFEPLERVDRDALIIAAVHAGDVRLIDCIGLAGHPTTATTGEQRTPGRG
jgi:pantoate--beta-alanine ligase